ncbi:MAG: hypothetical protein V4642_01965 [Bacteroidota bacterium]
MQDYKKTDHPIIEKPWEYHVVEFYYNSNSNDVREHFILMKLKKENEYRLFKFQFPRDLKIEEGFPRRTGGMEFIDLSKDGLEDINVKVGDFELSWGAITFYAKSVIELPTDVDSSLLSE